MAGLSNEETEIITTSEEHFQELVEVATDDPEKAFSTDSAFCFEQFFHKYSAGLFHALSQIDVRAVSTLAEELRAARNRNAQIFILGNGGSASNASHFVADLAKDRFGKEEYLFRVTSLVDNTPLVTATANDFGYENVFSQQLVRHVHEGDVVIAISTSGNSENVLRAIDVATEKRAKTFGITGFDGGKLAPKVDVSLHVPTKPGQYGFMEDITSIFVHMVTVYIYECDKVELATQSQSTLQVEKIVS